MANYLKMLKRKQVLALLELGWSYRRIQAETGVRRETVSRYDRIRRARAANAFPGSGDLAAFPSGGAVASAVASVVASAIVCAIASAVASYFYDVVVVVLL